MWTENEIAREVVDAAYQVHSHLGPGLLESVYQTVMVHELRKRGLKIETQVPIPVIYDSIILQNGFRADVVVENKVILEFKSIEEVAAVHKKQLLTYIRLADKRLGLLINFGALHIKDGITRIVNKLQE